MKQQKSVAYNYTGSLLAAISLPVLLTYFIFMIPGMDDVKGEAFILNPVFLISSAMLIVVAPVAMSIYFKRRQLLQTQEYINLSVLRYAVAYLMFFYGYSKMVGKFFDVTYLTQDSRVADVDSFYMTWYYFGKSNIQEFIIGLLELVPAIMLLFRRTTFMGALLLLPVAMNVMMINTFNHISGLTFPISIFIGICNTYIIYSYKKEIVAFLRNMVATTTPQLTKEWRIARITFKIVVIVMMLVFTLEMLMYRTPIFGKKTDKSGNKIKGGFEQARLIVNGKVIPPGQDTNRFYKSIYLEPQSRWNCILFFSSQYSPHALKIIWNKKNDSVTSYQKTKNVVSFGSFDSATKFKGTYTLAANKLYVKGIQYGDTISAVYIKKDLVDYNWFW